MNEENSGAQTPTGHDAASQPGVESAPSNQEYAGEGTGLNAEEEAQAFEGDDTAASGAGS